MVIVGLRRGINERDMMKAAWDICKKARGWSATYARGLLEEGVPSFGVAGGSAMIDVVEFVGMRSAEKLSHA
jgi:hypothetical protein